MQNGSAAISWTAPDTDGGAAITAYQLTVYNPDGSVNQTSTYGPGTPSATVTGLTGSGTYPVGLAAVNAAGSSAAATVPVQAIPAGWSPPNTNASDEAVTMSLDPASGNLTFVSASANNYTYDSNDNLLSSQSVTPDTNDLWTGLGLGSYSCVKNAGQARP